MSNGQFSQGLKNLLLLNPSEKRLKLMSRVISKPIQTLNQNYIGQLEIMSVGRIYRVAYENSTFRQRRTL